MYTAAAGKRDTLEQSSGDRSGSARARCPHKNVRTAQRRTRATQRQTRDGDARHADARARAARAAACAVCGNFYVSKICRAPSTDRFANAIASF